MIKHRPPVNIVQSPASWHTHEVDPHQWWKALVSELRKIEEHPPRV